LSAPEVAAIGMPRLALRQTRFVHQLDRRLRPRRPSGPAFGLRRRVRQGAALTALLPRSWSSAVVASRSKRSTGWCERPSTQRDRFVSQLIGNVGDASRFDSHAAHLSKEKA
jgi:hypothetical protein